MDRPSVDPGLGPSGFWASSPRSSRSPRSPRPLWSRCAHCGPAWSCGSPAAGSPRLGCSSSVGASARAPEAGACDGPRDRSGLAEPRKPLEGMTVKLLAVGAVGEAATGLVLVVAPARFIQLLLGAELSGAGIVLGRLT